MVIAIDGESANGKSTLAEMLAKELNLKNFNTGTIYRCYALEIKNKNLNPEDVPSLIEHLKTLEIEEKNSEVYLNGEVVTSIIRSPEITYLCTKWAHIPELKALIKTIQDEAINNGNVIMEGRDIGTKIAPNADFKFYLYADIDTRVKRKWLQNPEEDIEDIKRKIIEKDEKDRKDGSFIIPNNAHEIDTSEKTLEEVFEIMLNIINNK